MSETIFSKIIRREVPADIVYEDELILAFRDLHPQAPVHILVIPKQPITSIATVTEADQSILGHLLIKIALIAKQAGLVQGYRVVTNIGTDGGQTVSHLHFHLLGQRQMTWPPG